MKLGLPSHQMRTKGRRATDTALAFLSQLVGDFPIVLNLSDLFAHIMRTCRVELGFDSCSLALVDEDDGGSMTIQATSGVGTGYMNLKIPAGQGLHGEAVRTGQPLLVPDLAADTRVYHLAPNMRSAIITPLRAGGRIMGVLAAFRSTPDAFAPAELDLLTVVAGYVAGAVEISRLHDRLKEQALDSSHQLAQALDLVSVALVIASLDDGTILRWNRAAGDIYGYAAAEVVGQAITMLEPPDQQGALTELLAGLRRGDPSRMVDAVHLGKEGQRRRITLTARPMRNAAGQVRWAVLDIMAY